jgi:Zn-dependent protease with chaperone function
MDNRIRANPTDAIDVGFKENVESRRASAAVHMENGVPDYAYSADFAMQKKLRAVPGLFAFCKAVAAQHVPRAWQELNLTAMKAGPSQFPEVYQMSVDCSRILGIGVPTVFIKPSPQEINAAAYAVEGNAPLIYITSALAERATPGELKSVIGHECGHIHNNHGIYNTAVELLLNAAGSTPLLGQLLKMATAPIRLALMAWSRAAEVTCDRAGIICSDNINDTLSIQAKFMYGGTINRKEYDLDTVLSQFEAHKATPARLLELIADHPSSIRRIFAAKEFINSEILYQWRPEWKDAEMDLIGKEELDGRTERIISVVGRNLSRKKAACLTVKKP